MSDIPERPVHPNPNRPRPRPGDLEPISPEEQVAAEVAIAVEIERERGVNARRGKMREFRLKIEQVSNGQGNLSNVEKDQILVALFQEVFGSD